MARDVEPNFDEDVILPNSPLAEYLREFDSNESTYLFSEFSTQQKIDTEKCKQYHEKQCTVYLLRTSFLEKFKYWKNSLSFILLQSSFEKGNSNLKAFLNGIIKSTILTHEDESFIRHLISEPLVPDKEHSYFSNPLPFNSFSFFSTFCMLCVAFILHNFIVTLPSVLILLIIIPMCSFILYCKHMGRQYEKASSHLISFPSSTKIALAIIKSCCIRLIQETELISRGFTSASHIGAAEHIELSFALPVKSPSRQYSQLRRYIFDCLRTTFVGYRTLTLEVLQNMPVEAAFTLPSCLATLGIGEFGGLLNYDLDSPEILDVTDSFSIQSLKTMHYLAKMQISEFFKQVAIRVYLLNGKSPADIWKLIKNVQWLFLQTQNMDNKMNLMYKDIYKTYKYYKSIEASYITEKEVQNCLQPQSPKVDLKIIVHNMSLHLKAALLRMIDIESKFDNKDEVDQIVSKLTSDTSCSSSELEIETEFKNHILTLVPLLDIAKSEIVAFEECYNKFHTIVDTLLYPKKEIASIPKDESEPENTDLVATLERCDVEREIQDEVFEAIVSNTCHDDKQEGAAFVGEEARKNSELASFMLKELKNVLVNKADEHRAREQIALAKKGVETDQGNLSSEESKTEKDANCGSENSLEECEDFHLEKDVGPSSFLNLLSDRTDSFAASIATLAAHRQQVLGLSNEEFIDGSDNSDSDL